MLCEALLTYTETLDFSIIMLMVQMVALRVPFSLIFSHCRVLVHAQAHANRHTFKVNAHTTHLIPYNHSVFPLADTSALSTSKCVCFYLRMGI